MTLRRLTTIEDIFRTDCAPAKISTTFEAKTPSQSLSLQTMDTQSIDLEQAEDKTLENLCHLVSVDNRDRRDTGRDRRDNTFERS